MDINYLSDDDNKISNDNNFDDSYGDYNDYDEYIEAYDLKQNNIDEEIEAYNEEEAEQILEHRKLIWEKTRNLDNNSLFFKTKEKISQKKNSKKTNKEDNKKIPMSISDFNSYADKLAEENKPKKFVSKRLLDKKGLHEAFENHDTLK